MATANTYVISINGLTGNRSYEVDYFDEDENPVYGIVPHEHHPLVIDGTDIHITGDSGPTISQVLPTIASTMRPLIMEQIDDSEDYIMHVQSGIPYEPAIVDE